MDRQDRKAVETLAEQMQALPDAACYALATSLVTAAPRLDWMHPIGAYHKDFSHESAAGARARALLALEAMAEADWGWREPQTHIDLEALASQPGDLREFVASLMTHHLRLAGKVEAVSQVATCRLCGCSDED